jgi:uncharacterized caspase-like protein
MTCVVRLLAIGGALIALCAGPAEARRVALVIGNAAYKVGPLANPVNDATAVADALGKQLEFDKVILKRNLTFDGFRAALIEMAREAAGAELGLVYFAGHGTEVAGRTFLIPVDASLATASSLDVETIPLDTVLSQLGGVKRLKLVILDACRNNPFVLPGAKRSVGRGLARIEPEDNTLVAYAARDGTTADDGPGRRHSPYTAGLLKHMATPNLEVRLLFGRVRDDVMAATNAVQQPHIYQSLGGREFYLQPQAGWLPLPAPAPAAQPQLSEAERAWAAAKDATDPRDLEAFRRQYGAANPFYDRLAERRIEELRKRAAVAAPAAKAPEKGSDENLSPEMLCCIAGQASGDRLIANQMPVRSRSQLIRDCERGLRTNRVWAKNYRDPEVCAFAFKNAR